MKHQIRKVVSLLLALTMILSTMPLASASMVAHVIKSAVLEPNNTADIQYRAVGEALVVCNNIYDSDNLTSQVVYDTADEGFQLSEAQSGELYYTDVRGYVYSYNTYKYINIKTGEASFSTDAILQNREDPGIHPADSAAAGGMRYYQGEEYVVKSTQDSERTLAFEGVFDVAGEFSTDSNYARVISREEKNYGVDHINIDSNDIAVNKSGGVVSFTITDSNLQQTYPCNQSFVPTNKLEHGWDVFFNDGTYEFMIGTRTASQKENAQTNKALNEMQNCLWVHDGAEGIWYLYSDATLAIDGTHITWSIDTDTIMPSLNAVNNTNVQTDYKINPESINVTGGAIRHLVADDGNQTVPVTTVTQNVYQIINKSGDVVYTDDGSGVLATHYIGGVFHNDMLLVTEPDTYQMGYMDETGTLVIPCVYADAYDFHNGYARVDSGYYSDENEGRSMSLIDTSGNTIIEEGTYDVITDVDSDGMLWAVSGNTVYHLRIVAQAPSSGGGGAVSIGLSGGINSLVGTNTNAELRGLITAANPSAGTVEIGGTSLTYSDGFNDTKLGSVVVGSYVHVYLDTAGKIAGYYISLSGAITAIHTGNGTVTVNGTKYYYHSSITAGEQIPSSVIARQCSLYLDGDGKIVWWHVQGGANATVDGYVTAVTNDTVELRDEWDSANTTTYQYVSDFSGVKFESQDVGRWTYDVRLDDEGKITDYRLHEDGIVVSASSNSITLTPEDGSSDVTYNYSSSFNGEKLTTGATGKRGNLNLNSNREITYCSLHDYGTITAANSSNETVTIQHSSASGNVETSYSYANDFNGLKIGAEHIGQWINVNMDASGKILWYLIDLEDESNNQDTVEILSVTPTIIGRGETVNLEVTVRYNLTTVSTGIVYLGVNTNAENSYQLVDETPVTSGAGAVMLTATVTTATGWDTAIYANLSDANHGEEWSPLASDRWNVGANLIASGTCGASANWTLNSAGTLTISGTGAMADYGYDNESRAPWYSYASSIKRVVIQSGITRIGSCAFDQCINLADVSIPNTVTTIGNNSFQLCGSLTSISFPNSLKTIEHSVFYGSGLTSVTVPDSVTRIDNSAFSGCGGLISAKLGNGIQKIDEYLFTEDSKLTSLTIPKNVTEIAPNAFSYTGIKKFSVANGNTAFSAEDGVLYNAAKTSIVCYPPQGNVNYIIPKTVGTADLSLFWKTSIETIRISSGTTVTNTETIPDTFGSAASGSLKLYFQGDVTNTSGWEFLNKTGEKISVTAEQWEYHEDEIALSNAVLYVPYYANTVSTIDGDSLNPPFYASGLIDTGLEVDITGGFVTGAPLATGKTIFTVSTGAKTYTFSVTTRENNTTTVTAETSEDLVIEKTVSNMTTSTVSDQVFEIEDKDKDETTEVKSNFEKFLDVYLDGVKLVGGKIEPSSTDPDAIKSVDDVPDDWEYYAEEGSTKITVRAQTFQNKSSGTHTIAATFEKTVVDPVTQVETREVITAAQNFAITTSDGGGNGGGGGGGGGSPAAAQQPAAETKTPELSYSVTNGVAALDSTSVTQMAASATEQKSDTLTLDLTNGGETVTAVSLPAGLMDQIAQLAASGENSVDSLAIVLSSGSLELDAETLSEIAQQAGGESISMALEEVSADQLSDGQQAALAELSAEKIISIEISCADKQITDFGGGRVNLSIPFTAAADKNARGYAVWHLADDGKTSRHSTGYADGKISFRTAHFSNYAVAYREPNLFTDVLDGLWYTNDVDHVAALGIMNGVSGAKFAPNTALTRAMFAQIIYNAENGTAGAPSSFSDVPDGMWYTDAVNWAAQNRIVSGIGNSQYAPDREITREELVMMLYNYATYKGYDAKTDVELTRFSDSSSVSTWAETAMKWAVRNKLINGVGEKLLAGDKATRAQVAKVMAYFLEQYAR